MVTKNSTLLLTRPIESSNHYIAKLDIKGETKVVVSPIIEIVPLLPPPTVGAVIFTSRNGVKYAGQGDHRAAYCVGEKTAEQARAVGFDVKLIEQTATDLLKALVSNPPNFGLTHLRGEHARGNIALNLNFAGINCDEYILYGQRPMSLNREAIELLRSGNEVVIPLFSPRSARLLFDELDKLHLPYRCVQKFQFVALSSAVSEQIPKSFRENTVVSAQPTGNMMLQIVSRFFE